MTLASLWNWAAAAALALTAAGCIKTTSHKLARLQPGAAAPATQPAPETAAYEVRVRKPGDQDYRPVHGTWRLLRAGDPVGFSAGDHGELYAIAGPARLPLRHLGQWERLMWYAESSEQTQFSREVNEALTTAARAAGAAAVITANAILEDECDEDDQYWNRRFKEEEKAKGRRK